MTTAERDHAYAQQWQLPDADISGQTSPWVGGSAPLSVKPKRPKSCIRQAKTGSYTLLMTRTPVLLRAALNGSHTARKTVYRRTKGHADLLKPVWSETPSAARVADWHHQTCA